MNSHQNSEPRPETFGAKAERNEGLEHLKVDKQGSDGRGRDEKVWAVTEQDY